LKIKQITNKEVKNKNKNGWKKKNCLKKVKLIEK